LIIGGANHEMLQSATSVDGVYTVLQTVESGSKSVKQRNEVARKERHNANCGAMV
jgi:hypothetical protein